MVHRTKVVKDTWICFIVCIALAILSSVFLYQVFAPGTSYRFFLCKQGRLSGSAFFQYIPLQATSLYPQVRGIEFEFSVLMQKTDHPRYKRLNITGVRYYMNIDRCAYKSNTQSSNSVLTNPVTYGHDVFAVDKECYNAFYFKDEKWWRYDFVSWETKQNIFCHPPSTSKNFTWS
ncbi:uncharacterized protein LOC136071759 [Hydra vulgaris]|uniref:uncharacterized protein LOC136071759 n=1 Tax=Hydra vulgaris TaxID=6087 RepID=UPI0032EA6FFA